MFIKKNIILLISVMIGMVPSFVVSAEELRDVRDLYAEVVKDGILINNMRVEVEVKKCNHFWSFSNWTQPEQNGIFYENLHGEGIYRAEVTEFLFGTYYGSCPVFFKFDGIRQVNIELNIRRFPFRCPSEIVCTTIGEDSINP